MDFQFKVDTPQGFSAVNTKGDNFCCEFSFASVGIEALPKWGSTPKGKNLVIEELIYVFKSIPQFRR